MTTRRSCAVDVHLILHLAGSVLLGLRQNTGWFDGRWHLPSTRPQSGESARAAAARTATTQLGVLLDPDQLDLAHTRHHRTDTDRLALFFTTTTWTGSVANRRPSTCKTWEWHHLAGLPDRTVPYAAHVLSRYRDGDLYSQAGWNR